MATGNYYIINGLRHARVSYVISEFAVNIDRAVPKNNACDLGTLMHLDIQRYLCGESDRQFELKAQFLRFMDTHINPAWKLRASEELVFNADARIAGTVDALFVNKITGRLMIIDWKRTRCLYAESMIQYQLQLNLYRHIIGIDNVDIIGLVILHPDNHNFHFVEVPFIDVAFYIDNAIHLI